MAKALTKSQIAAEIAAKNSLTKKQAVEILESIVQPAYKNAKNTFTFPGLGKLDPRPAAGAHPGDRR